MRTSLKMVQEFHEVFELWDQIQEHPTIPAPKVSLLRIQCFIEEVGELALALGNGDLVKVLDGLTDIQYFLDGTYIACGLAALKDQAMEEVHRSNLTKLDENGKPIINAAGRVVKGPNYEPPQLEAMLEVALELKKIMSGER